MSSKENLIIVVSSKNIDTYVNVICCAYFRHRIKNIYLLHISGFSSGIRSDETEPLKNDIRNRIKKLIEQNKLYSEIYEFVTIRDVKKIQEEEIDNYLTKEVNNLRTFNKCMIDITPATKYISQIIFASSLINESRNIYKFQLFKKSEISDENLYHNLDQNNFDYINVSNKDAFKPIYSRFKKQKILNLFAISVSITVVLISIIVNVSVLTGIASISTIIACLLQFVAFLHKPN